MAADVLAQYPLTHNINNYSPVDYNSHNQNWGAVQDDRGVLYIANGNGILKYDGITWETIFTEYVGTALSIAINDTGIIYTGGIEEIGYLDINKEGKPQHVALNFLLPDSLQNFGNVWNTITNNGFVYFQSDQYLFVYDGDTIVHYFAQKEYSSCSKVNGKIWVHEIGKGLFVLNGNTPKMLPNSTVFSDKSIQKVLPYNDVEVLLVTGNFGVYLYNPVNGKVSEFNHELDLMEDVRIFSAGIIKNGLFAFGTASKGIFIIDKKGKIVSKYSEHEGLFSGRINDIYVDAEGIVWCLMNKGVSKINYGTPITMLYEGDSYKGNINRILEINNRFYIGTNEGLFCMTKHNPLKNEKSVYRIDAVKSQVFDLKSYKDGLLIATSNGIRFWNEESLTYITKEYSRTVNSFEHNEQTYVLATGRRKVWLLKDVQSDWKTVWVNEEFLGEVLRSEAGISDNDSLLFWLGLFSEGVVKYKISKDDLKYGYKHYNRDTSFSRGYVLPYMINGRNRFVTKFNEIYIYNHEVDSFMVDTTISNHLPEETSSYLLASDKIGDIYLEASGPMYILKKKKGSYIADKISLKIMDNGYVNDIFIDDENNCWMGCESALVRFNPSIEKDYQQPYYTILSKVEIGEDSIVIPSPIEERRTNSSLTFQQNELAFNFAAPYFESKIEQFAYYLEGYQENFGGWKNVTKASYTNLSEGEYTFKVKAKNVYGHESNVAAYHFTILPPWYRTWWMYLVYVVFVLVLIYAIIRLNSRRLQKANDRLKAIVDERTAEVVAQKVALEEKNTEIMDSILYAERIQRALLQSEEYVNNELPKHFIFFKPKDIVSGDFYWAKESGDYFYLTAADCTGHGVPGAFMSMLGISFLNEILSNNKGLLPSEVLDRLRDKVILELGQGANGNDSKDGMDMSLIRINRKTYELCFAGANNPLWLVSKRTFKDESIFGSVYKLEGVEGKIYEFKADRQPVAYYSGHERPFTNYQIKLEKGDSLYLFSDGYADQFGGEKGKKYKYKTLKNLFLSMYHKPLDTQKRQLEVEFEQWKGSFEQIDDVCIIGVRI